MSIFLFFLLFELECLFIVHGLRAALPCRKEREKKKKETRNKVEVLHEFCSHIGATLSE